MGAEDWRWIAPISISGFVTIEIIKLIFRRIRKTGAEIKRARA